jgi:hypothetical protein
MGKFKNYQFKNEYSEVLKYLQEHGKVSTRTEEDTSFDAEACIYTKQSRLHPIEPYIGFFQYSKAKQKAVLYARCYKVDWGNYLNESGTRIGMYCKALDKEISTLLPK